MKKQLFLVLLTFVLAVYGGFPAYGDTFHTAVLGISRVETQVAPLKTCTGVMLAPDWVLTRPSLPERDGAPGEHA